MIGFAMGLNCLAMVFVTIASSSGVVTWAAGGFEVLLALVCFLCTWLELTT